MITDSYKETLPVFSQRALGAFRFAATLLCALAYVAIASSPLHAEQLRIVVGDPTFNPLPVAVPKAANTTQNRNGAAIARRAQTALRDGVAFVRALSLISPDAYLVGTSKTEAPKYDAWLNVGASALIETRVIPSQAATQKSNAAPALDFQLLDVISQKLLLQEQCETEELSPRFCARKFLDQAIQTLTGEPGILLSQIAYVKGSRAGKNIYISDPDGGRTQAISRPADLGLLPAWSPSGDNLLFTAYLSDEPHLWRLQLTTGKLSPLSTRPGLNTGASVSPDGQTIALTLSIDGNAEIYTMNTQGKNLTRLTRSFGNDVSPTWSPDGQHIAFVSSRSGQAHIYRMRRDGTKQRRLTFQGTYNQEPDWSPRPDGGIAFTGRDEHLRYDIFIVSTQTGIITRLTQNEGDNESPSFSPDGQQLVFSSTRDGGGRKRLYVCDMDGNNPRRISSLGGGDFETPTWGPRMDHQKLLKISRVNAQATMAQKP